VKIGTAGFSGSLIKNLMLKAKNSKWWVQYGGCNYEILTDLCETRCLGVFGVADNESDLRNSKFNMADSLW
jgi:hypothetical protein